MTVIEIGDIRANHSDDALPKRGIVIEATDAELKALPNLCYKEVEIKEAAK